MGDSQLISDVFLFLSNESYFVEKVNKAALQILPFIAGHLIIYILQLYQNM